MGKRCWRGRFWPAVVALGCWSLPASGQPPMSLEIICPCSVERDGDTLTATLGARNNVATPTGELHFELASFVTIDNELNLQNLGRGSLDARLGGNETLAPKTVVTSEIYSPTLPGEYELFLALRQDGREVDRVCVCVCVCVQGKCSY